RNRASGSDRNGGRHTPNSDAVNGALGAAPVVALEAARSNPIIHPNLLSHCPPGIAMVSVRSHHGPVRQRPDGVLGAGPRQAVEPSRAAGGVMRAGEEVVLPSKRNVA